MTRNILILAGILAAAACAAGGDRPASSPAGELVGRWDIIEQPASFEFYPGGSFSFFGEAGTETGTYEYLSSDRLKLQYDGLLSSLGPTVVIVAHDRETIRFIDAARPDAEPLVLRRSGSASAI
jgi:hypothetical protein